MLAPFAGNHALAHWLSALPAARHWTLSTACCAGFLLHVIQRQSAPLKTTPQPIHTLKFTAPAPRRVQPAAASSPHAPHAAP